jgi:hypothetical protein
MPSLARNVRLVSCGITMRESEPHHHMRLLYEPFALGRQQTPQMCHDCYNSRAREPGGIHCVCSFTTCGVHYISKIRSEGHIVMLPRLIHIPRLCRQQLTL